MTKLDLETSDQHRARAVAKLNVELSKDIARAKGLAHACGLWDLMRLCYLLRLNRLQMVEPTYTQQMSHADSLAAQLTDDALKYAVALVAQHGDWKNIPSDNWSIKGFDNERVILLSELARQINAKFETLKLLHVAEVKVSGARDEYATLDMAEVASDPKRAMYFDFGIRIERFAMRNKKNLLSIEDLVRKFYMAYADVGEAFEAVNGLTLAEYCEGIVTLAALFQDRAAHALAVIADSQGRVFYDHAKTFVALARSMIFTDAELDEMLSADFRNYLRANSFDASAQNGSELRFHYLSRRPFFLGAGFSILSPELVLDSVFDNAHFTLLENKLSKESYKNTKSGQFLDQIAEVGLVAGYQEVDRDLDLFIGNDPIGDIDLILHNAESGHTLLIEAKNHALPLDVYFATPDAIDGRLEETLDWTRKVERRIESLRGSEPSYVPPGEWDYVVVSRMPEPISHVTSLLILCLDEFEFWLGKNRQPTTFVEVLGEIYKNSSSGISIEELEELHDQGFFLPNFDLNGAA